ncbi:MAG TPA: SDR family NAD(P)-dependent oxidoreductase [Candidatus Hydrogenedentes bacterium]|nr:SDR family NAD(P)-dependent oxidoreductase [Candidatus Hydrogenedentota bacterium]HRK36436.1 SDR family NAD(P)-dependent oxidoreductase [Candidatus Hydrogenedentota bacterium]
MNKRIIVTGASKGIGKGIATFLAMDGFRVGLIARSRDLLEDLRQSIEAQGGDCFAAACDLRDPDETSYAINAVAEHFGGVDALINNAGLVIRKSVFDISTEEWRAMIETNINGPFFATRAVLPHFTAQGHGHIVNLSSISGKMPLAGGSGYAATKFAITGFSQSLFQEVRDMGIKVTTLYPGSVDSESHRHDFAADNSWKVSPAEVGAAVRDVLMTAPGTVISELEIRPLRKPTGT